MEVKFTPPPTLRNKCSNISHNEICISQNPVGFCNKNNRLSQVVAS